MTDLIPTPYVHAEPFKVTTRTTDLTMNQTQLDGPCSDDIGNLPVPTPSDYNIRTNSKGQTIVIGIEGKVTMSSVPKKILIRKK